MNFTRDEFIYLARIHDRAEKYEDMVKFIIQFCKMDPNLNPEERDLLAAGFKNLISTKRNSWRILDLMERKEEKKKSNNLICLKEVKSQVESEIKRLCNDIQNLLEEYVIPASEQIDDKEALVFYFKLQGDYFRYRAEVTTQSEFDKCVDEAESAYHKAYELAENELIISNPLRLGVALNFSVFCYEIANQKEEAVEIAKNAFEESMKILDDLERTKAKDTIIIIQILKENLILWNNELMDD